MSDTRQAPSSRRPESAVPPDDWTCPGGPDYNGPVFVWDLDKTYLQTEFHSLRDLVRTALENAEDKIAYPGAATLLNALRKGPDGQVRPTYFVSASPPQMRDVISEKLRLDGVDFDGIYFKDNLRNLRPGRTDRLREQIGYKLLALLDLRKRLPVGAVETLFGDDTETDPRAYSLYSHILEGRLEGTRLVGELIHRGVFRDEAIRIAWRARHLAPRRGVERIHILVHRTHDLATLSEFDPRLVPSRNYFQTALGLWADRRIALETVAGIGDELLVSGHPQEDLASHLFEISKHRDIKDAVIRQAAERLVGFQILSDEALRRWH